MSIVTWIILGLIAGWIAGLIMKGGGYGILGDIVVGIVGALLGGWLGSALFGLDVSGLNFTSVVLAILGAIILIAIYRAIVGGHREAL